MKKCNIIVVLIISSTMFAHTLVADEASSPQETPVGYGNNEAAGAYAEVNGINMYYEVYGEGEPLVLIHGNGDSIKGLSPQIEHLSKTHKVYIADSRGHGKSEAGEREFTYELMAEDWSELIETVEIQPANIFGHSDGGIIGLLLGIHHPETVGKIAIMGANLNPGPEAADAWAHEWVQGKLKDAEDNIQEGDTSEGLRIWRQKLRLLAYHPDISVEELGKIESPVLVMAGDRDIIRLEHTVAIFQNLKNAQLCIFPGQTHFATVTDPELFNSTLEKFFLEPFSMPSSQEYMSGW